jgi:hypothetical protein
VIEDILKAVGICASAQVSPIAESLRLKGSYEAAELYSTIFFIGDDIGTALKSKYPASPQRPWNHLLRFIYDRFRRFEAVKTQVDQWDDIGQDLHSLSITYATSWDAFAAHARRKFGLPLRPED